MSNICITSDWHFCHDRDFLYAPRGFHSVWEMNKELVARYNEVVDRDDDVYVLKVDLIPVESDYSQII